MSIPIYMSLCIDCKYRIRENMPKGNAYCKAYPEGIPFEVWKEKSKPSADKDAPCPNGYKFKHIKSNNTNTAE